MKKILFSLIAFGLSMSLNAQIMKIMKGDRVVATYNSEQADKVVFEDDEIYDHTGEVTTGFATATYNGETLVVKWIRLWNNGPKFADYNVGVTDGKPESYGGYYGWGMTIDRDPNNSINSSMSLLTGNEDTATALWGDNWRMPTNDEYQALLDKCDVQWTTLNGIDGRMYTGRGYYSGNSIFFPASGLSEDGRVESKSRTGCYWTRVPSDSKRAYRLYFEYEYNVVDGSKRGLCESVRAVLKDN